MNIFIVTLVAENKVLAHHVFRDELVARIAFFRLIREEGGIPDDKLFSDNSHGGPEGIWEGDWSSVCFSKEAV